MMRKLFIIILAALATGLIALVFVKIFLMKSTYKPPGQSKTFSLPITTMPTTSSTMPANLLKIANEPFHGLGLKPLVSIPHDIFAPEGATKCFAISRNVPGGTVDIVSYFVSLSSDEVQKFYKDALIERGYKLLQQRTGMRQGEVLLTFIPQNHAGKADALQRYYIVEIKGSDKNVKITIIVSRPKGR